MSSNRVTIKVEKETREKIRTLAQQQRKAHFEVVADSLEFLSNVSKISEETKQQIADSRNQAIVGLVGYSWKLSDALKKADAFDKIERCLAGDETKQ